MDELSVWAEKHEGRDSRCSGIHGLEAVGVCDYTGGLQEGGPIRVENLMVVTSQSSIPTIPAP